MAPQPRRDPRLTRALAEAKAAGASGWIVGLRANQSRERSSVRLAGWDPATGYPTAAKLRGLGLDWLAART